MQIKIIDTHCHLQDFDTRAPEVWNRACRQGLQNCIVVGTNPKDAEKAARLAKD